MFRKVITDGDLMLTYKPWWSLSYTPYRNLSEEVRCLKELEENAMSKYKELASRYQVASINVADELETLQVLLLENSDAYFEVDVDNSILDKREGMRYQYNRKPNNKKGSSSNKENQQKQNQGKQNQSQSKGRGIPISKLLGASLVLH